PSHRPGARITGAVLVVGALSACSSQKSHETHDAAPPAMIDAPAPDAPPAPPPAGRWTTGDLHLHTIQSNDAQVPLDAVLAAAFAKHHLDWIAVSNHLRVSNRDDQGNDVQPGPIPLSQGLAEYEVPAITALQQA